MLPFLKNQKEAAIVAPADPVEMETGDYDMIDAVAEDLLAALEKKDKGRVKAALTALCEHIQDMDKQQDKEMEK